MSRNSKAAKHPVERPPQKPGGWWPYAVSVLIILHLVAVVIPPFTHATLAQRPADRGPFVTQSPLGARLETSFLRPYIDAAFLDHGYAFFAPNPPRANYLIRYRLEFDDGRPAVEQTFPDLKRHWPRLLYHRHLMLTSQINDDFDMNPELAQKKWESFRHHLKSKYAASRVTLTRVEHFVPEPADFKNGWGIRDPRLYRDLPVPWEETAPPEELP